MPAAGPPPVPRAEEALAVAAFFERLPVVRAGDGLSLLLVPGELGSFSEDVDELVPADTSSPPSASAAALLGPP